MLATTHMPTALFLRVMCKLGSISLCNTALHFSFSMHILAVVPGTHEGLGAPEVADAAIVDVEGTEGCGRQPQRDAQQRAQDGLVRHHQVRAARRLQHLCAHGTVRAESAVARNATEASSLHTLLDICS